jgi:hypothetical protein
MIILVAARFGGRSDFETPVGPANPQAMVAFWGVWLLNHFE